MNQFSNEFLNRFIRRGEGTASLTGFPPVDQIVDRQRRLLQAGRWVPLEDALRATVACARSLLDSSASVEDAVIGVDRDTLERLLLGLIRIESVQHELVEAKPPLAQRIEGERKVVKACHSVATAIAAKLEKAPRTTFESFADLVARAPDPQVTLRLLAQSGKSGPTLMDGNGTLPAINKVLPATLPAGGAVELRVRVHRVDDRTSMALVENMQALDETSGRLLSHHAKECELRFDGESIERADLTAAQYLDVPIRIRCAAECAVLPGQARKSNLTLVKVLEARAVMDGMHRAARQYQLKLSGDQT